MARGGATEQAARTSFRDVFAIAEFRALWMAQLLSVVGDQLARVALTVLVYDRTRSALLAAVTFVVSIVPTFIGGVTLAWLADRYPRRGVMIACDLIRVVLVLVMAIPGLPLAAMVVLLFVVTLTEIAVQLGPRGDLPRRAHRRPVRHGNRGDADHVSVRAGHRLRRGRRRGRLLRHPDIAAHRRRNLRRFGAHRPRLGPAAARAGGRPAPRVDPGRPTSSPEPGSSWPVRPCARRLLFGLLAAFYNAPEGVAAPLASALGGGAAAVGVILAANSLGQTVGAIAFSRFVAPATRLRFMGPLAICACAVLILFFAKPDLAVSLLILVASGLCAVLSAGRQRRLRARGAARTAQPSLRPGPGRDEPGSGRGDDPGGGRGGTSRSGTGHRGVRRRRRRRSAGGRRQRGPRPAE